MRISVLTKLPDLNLNLFQNRMFSSRPWNLIIFAKIKKQNGLKKKTMAMGYLVYYCPYLGNFFYTHEKRAPVFFK